MLIEITSKTEKTPKEIADVIFKRLDSVSGLISGYTDLRISSDDDNSFVIIFEQEKEKQIRDLVQQFELELNFSTKWRNHKKSPK